MTAINFPARIMIPGIDICLQENREEFDGMLLCHVPSPESQLQSQTGFCPGQIGLTEQDRVGKVMGPSKKRPPQPDGSPISSRRDVGPPKRYRRLPRTNNEVVTSKSVFPKQKKHPYDSDQFPGEDNDVRNRYLPAGNRKEFDGMLFCALSRPGIVTGFPIWFFVRVIWQRSFPSFFHQKILKIGFIMFRV
ncbi:hypothetical protein CDAR_302501 [Caerostris darwini]|uniref:Uncharacterized protein n=1 Tax=Caerostris darwini TaxID=1538125 RepID=A0AAV4NE46_9ARAC|nr:hypothetical protein CDAR_302501 [Caerostris darwini]